jgi:hypothetical protein
VKCKALALVIGVLLLQPAAAGQSKQYSLDSANGLRLVNGARGFVGVAFRVQPDLRTYDAFTRGSSFTASSSPRWSSET